MSLAGRAGRWPGEIHLHAAAHEDPARIGPGPDGIEAGRLPRVHPADGLPGYEGTKA